jgi:F-type H+-transporting ATPase subunit delta
MKGSAMNAQIVEPYASALMDLAGKIDKVDQFAENARALLTALDDSPEFSEFIANPLLKAEEKKDVLGRICGRDVDECFLNFLYLLTDRRRIIFLAGILEEFIDQQRRLKNIVLAEVTTASELTRDQEDAIADKVKAMTDAASVELKIATDESLIGGVIIKVGSQVLDASLKGQLRRISMGLLGS